MLASFHNELQKIAFGASVVKATGNVVKATKPVVGGKGANVIGKPLPTPGIGKGTVTSPKPAQPTNYSMVNSNAPNAAFDGGAGLKAVPPPHVES